MKNKDLIQERNEAIVKFWGGHQYPIGRWYNIRPNQNGYYSTLKYDTWDWLIPVVEKIEAAGYDTSITYHQGINVTPNEKVNQHGFTISACNGEEIICRYSNNKIEAVFLAVSDFCIQYNNQIINK